MMQSVALRGRGRLGPAALALVSLSVGAIGAMGQVDPKADPHQKMLEDRHSANHPATLVVSEKAGESEVVRKAINLLGESPIAAILEASEPDVRMYIQHNMTLANPFFEGRVPGSRGNVLAAEYIQHWYERAGLRPAFAGSESAADGTEVLTPRTSYRQTFSRGSEMTVALAKAVFDLGHQGKLNLDYQRDFTVLGMSGTGDAAAPIVLAGYGIEEGRDGYSSFAQGDDLKGKIAVVFRFEPMKEDGRSKWAERGWSPAASLDAKIRAVEDRGAAGVILVNPPGAADPRAGELTTLRETRARVGGEGHKIPVIMASPAQVEQLVQAADPTDGPARTLLDWRKQFDERGGIVDLPNAAATIQTRLSMEPIRTDNVGGILPGKGALAERFIVIGAHYDHVGYGPTGTQPGNIGKLHPGADDNASGTSGILVAAQHLADAYDALPAGAEARSILFLAFSAEESGLNGSRYFVNNPPPGLPLESIDLMLNMDMIGRLRESVGLEIQGTQSAAGFFDWLKPYFDASGLNIKHGATVATNSDHANFYQKKIPVLFFFTGLHREYHMPTDEAWRINQLGAARITRLASEIALGAAQRPGRWEFTPRRSGGGGGDAALREELAAARERAAASRDRALGQEQASPGRVGGRVRFGIAPGDYSDEKPGILVGDVYEGTSAADAGITIGDRMTKWNGKPLTDVESWMPMLMEHKPGDEVDVTVLRDGAEKVIKVKLKARDEGAR